jgi:ComF family protein
MIFEFLKDILAPKKCYWCGQNWKYICLHCLQWLKKYENICYVCKGITNNFELHNNCRQNIYYDKVIVFWHYKKNILSKMIKDFKFYNKKDIWKEFAENLVEIFYNNELYKNTSNYIIIHPPTTFFKKLIKWYNHSEIISKIFSDITKIKHYKNIIKKSINTRQQSKLNKKERLKNLNKAFKINKKQIDIVDNKKIIIIDDVISTWTTINEISKVLKKAWAKKIIALIVASD